MRSPSCLVKNFNLRDSLFLILESWMSPLVMYGSAVLFLGLPMGIGSCRYYRGAPQYTTLIFWFSSLCTLRQNIKRCDYCIQCIYLFIVTIYFYYYNTIHRYINTHLSYSLIYIFLLTSSLSSLMYFFS